MKGLLPVMGLLLCLSISEAIGDIYYYVDEEGVVHFSNVPTDERFKFYMKERSSFPKEEGSAYEGLIREACERYGVDVALVKAMIKAESDFNPRAVSRRGAMGLMQLMPGTASLLKVRDSFDPRQNVEGGVRYIRYLLDKYRGDLVRALAAYNAGEGAVSSYGRIPPYPETQRYVQKVLRYYHEYRGKGR